GGAGAEHHLRPDRCYKRAPNLAVPYLCVSVPRVRLAFGQGTQSQGDAGLSQPDPDRRRSRLDGVSHGTYISRRCGGNVFLQQQHSHALPGATERRGRPGRHHGTGPGWHLAAPLSGEQVMKNIISLLALILVLLLPFAS